MSKKTIKNKNLNHIAVLENKMIDFLKSIYKSKQGFIIAGNLDTVSLARMFKNIPMDAVFEGIEAAISGECACGKNHSKEIKSKKKPTKKVAKKKTTKK